MRKRDLYKDIGIKRVPSQYPYDVDIEKIKNTVSKSIDSASSERKSGFMKTKKKFILIALAATLVLGVTALAASNLVTTWESHSSANDEFTTLPGEEKCIEEIGYAPALVKSFENGYLFERGTFVKNNLKDENGNSVEKFNSVMFNYGKNGDFVIFSQEKFETETEMNGGKVVANADGVEIYYNIETYKNVPPDYKMTDEDKRAEESGELVFSYGASEVKISKVQSVTWAQGDMHYSLMQIDGKLSADELVQMAKEIIGK